MFKKFIHSLFGKSDVPKDSGSQIVVSKQKSAKSNLNIPKMLDLSSIDYYPLPPAPNHWESMPQEIIVPRKDFFEISERRDNDIEIAKVQNLAMEERPDPAYKIIMPSSLGFIEIDKNGKAKNLPGCFAAIALRDEQGNFIKEVGLDHSIYRIGLDHSAKHFALMDKEAVLHIYNEEIDRVASINLATDLRVIQIRDSEVSFYGEVRTSIRCVDVTSDGSAFLFTIADSAFLVNIFGETIWARSMPLGEGWVREFVKGERVGTSQEVFNALTFMQLTLPVTREQIRKNYRELSLKYHPDLNHSLNDQGEMMKKLNMHHDVLTGMDSEQLSKDPNKEHITYRRTKPDSVFKTHILHNNISYELSIEINTGGPPLDWIYAAAISNLTGGTYLGTYSGKVIKLDSHGEPEYALDVANVPREIIEMEQYLYILTDTRLYIVGKGQALVNIIDVHGQGKLAVSPEGFGLYSNKCLSWYTPAGAYKFRLGTKHPLRTFYFSGNHLIIETRQHRAFISFNGGITLPSQDLPKPKKQINNKGTGSSQSTKEQQTENDKKVPATLENLSSLKRAGRYEEAIEMLTQEVIKQEAEDKVRRWGVAPWAYGELAIIYRNLKDYKNEVEILERYMRQRQAPGAKPKQLAERLEKARFLLERTQFS
jgi:hypothetical protein